MSHFRVSKQMSVLLYQAETSGDCNDCLVFRADLRAGNVNPYISLDWHSSAFFFVSVLGVDVH